MFAGPEYRHFRLARTDEDTMSRRAHVDEERIFVVPYGERYEDLARFLNTLRPEVSAR